MVDVFICNGCFEMIIILFLGLRCWSSQLQVPPQIEVQLQILKYTQPLC